MANTLGPASIPFIACVFLLILMILHIVAFASPFWASDNINSFGLWRYHECTPQDDKKCRQFVRGDGEAGDWFHAVRGLECISIILWSIPLVVIPVYIYVAMGLYYRCMMATLFVFSLVATMCNIIAIIVFAVKINEKSWDAEWCIIVDSVAAGVGIIATFILLISIFNKPKFELQRHFLSGFYVDPDRNRMYVVENVEEPVKQPPSSVDHGQINPVLVE